MCARTLKEAASHLASSFLRSYFASPLHNKGSSNFHPMISELFAAYINVDPPIQRQKAITPRLLRFMFTSTGGGRPATRDLVTFVTAELAIIGFFWAMRSCKNTTPPVPGRTKIIRLRGVVFRDRDNNIIPHDSPKLSQAQRTTLTFENQKNGKQMDSRTQQATGDPILCPCARTASIVQRIYQTVPNANPDTPINTICVNSKTTSAITQQFLRNQLRLSCTIGGGKPTFGFDASEIGTRSIRSGAAMALFLMDHHPHKIMILGRWLSDAFLDYIRPQVLEWTNNMSSDMIRFNSFIDVSGRLDRATNASWQPTPSKFNGNGSMIVPKLHLHH